MGVIFDLDQTLIDSRAAEPLRKKRDWPAVYKLIPTMHPFVGINKLLADLDQAGIPVCIVSSAPSAYCGKVVTHWGWKVQGIVGYHDTDRRKPSPDPILKGIVHLGRPADQIISIGDDPKDILSSRAAKVFSVGALWGTIDAEALRLAKPDTICPAVGDLNAFLRSRYRLPAGD